MPLPQAAVKTPQLGVHVFAFFEKGLLKRIQLENADAFSYTPLGKGGDQERVLAHWLKAYIQGISAPLPHLDFAATSPFQQQVLSELLKLPFSKKISYKELAARIHRPGATRATGTACGKNPFPLVIPCHRVIRQNGSIGHYTGPKGLKNALLFFEKAFS